MDFEIGKIRTTHGLKGELKVFPTTDDPKRFDQLKNKQVYVVQDRQTGKYTIQSVRYQKDLVLVKFKEIDDIDQAAKLRAGTIKIDQSLAVPLEEGEFYLKDLYGMQVVSDTGETLGELIDIMFTGANNVYVVEPATVQPGKKKKDILIPHTQQCILNIDVEAKQMLVHIPNGLID